MYPQNNSQNENELFVRDSKMITNMVYYLSEHCLMDYQLSRKSPSIIASSCLAYTLLATKLKKWPNTLEKETGYTLENLLPTLNTIDNVLKNTKSQHKAVVKKYSQSLFCQVSLLNYNAFDLQGLVSKIMANK